MKDFEVTVKLRNNQLKARRKELGLGILALCKAAHIAPGAYMDLEGLKASPFHARDARCGGWVAGDWRKIAIKLGEFFGCSPEELFTDAIRRVRKSQIVAEFDIDQLPAAAVAQVPQLLPSPEDSAIASEAKGIIRDALSGLSEREGRILTKRFGLDGGDEQTLNEIGAAEGVTRETIRHIESRALGKLHKALRGSEVELCAK